MSPPADLGQYLLQLPPWAFVVIVLGLFALIGWVLYLAHKE